MIFNEEIVRSIADVLTDPKAAATQPYMNRTMAKKELDDFIADLAERFGAAVLAAVLDTIKELGFHNATLAGITISKNDIVIPPDKEEILAGYEERVAVVVDHFERGLITKVSGTSRQQRSGPRLPTRSRPRWRGRSTSSTPST